MSFKFKKTIALLSGIIVIAFTGCASSQNFKQSNDYIVQENSTKAINISRTKVFVGDGSFVVSGKLKRDSFRRSYPGHVDIAIINPDGSDFDHVSTKIALPFIGRSKRMNSSYKAEFAQMPPEGSTVRVSFHKKSALDRRQFDCSANASLSTHLSSD